MKRDLSNIRTFKRSIRDKNFEDSSTIRSYRDHLTNKFASNVELMRDFSRKHSVQTRHGKLNTRKLHKYSFDDCIFEAKQFGGGETSTVVFLLDNSASMGSTVRVEYGRMGLIMSAFRLTTVIASAFAKAVDLALPGEVNVEVFLKNCDSFYANDDFWQGACLTRIFSSSNSGNRNNADYDRLLRFQNMRHAFGNSGSTPELMVLPGLQKWCLDNVYTTNLFVVNLTDGMPNSLYGSKLYSEANNELNNAIFFKKFGSFFDMATVYIGKDNNFTGLRSSLENMYGVSQLLTCSAEKLPLELPDLLGKYLDKNII